MNENLLLLKSYLSRYGWKYSGKDELFEYYNNHLDIRLKFPLVIADEEYPRMLEMSLKKIKKINPEISLLPVFKILTAQCKNIKQKYSKEKKDWILSQPNSKYNLNEIPDIYIPKNDIFGTKE
jgi:hypothetical protein